MRLEQRLTKIENRMLEPDYAVKTIIISLLAADDGKPKVPQPDVIGAGMMAGDWHLSRNSGESVEDFTQRATASVPRNEIGFASILLEYAD